jgi:hypothetical protein
MAQDNDKIDRAVLALLYLGLHDVDRAWKGFDWEAMNRLHERGFISDPRGKAKSHAEFACDDELQLGSIDHWDEPQTGRIG